MGVRPRPVELGGWDRPLARDRRSTSRGALLGGRPRVLRTTSGQEGGRRSLLRLRRQVPARLDEDDGGRAVASGAPTSTLCSAVSTSRGTREPRGMLGDVPFNAFARAISGARGEPEHDAATARHDTGLVNRASVRTRVVGRCDRLEPPRRDRALVRAGQRACCRRDPRSRPWTRTASSVGDPAQAEEMGRRARERVLDEHTYAHRARRLLQLVRPQHPGLRRERSAPRRDRPSVERSRSYQATSSTRFDGSNGDIEVVVVDDASPRRYRRRSPRRTGRR